MSTRKISVRFASSFFAAVPATLRMILCVVHVIAPRAPPLTVVVQYHTISPLRTEAFLPISGRAAGLPRTNGFIVDDIRGLPSCLSRPYFATTDQNPDVSLRDHEEQGGVSDGH